MKKEINVYQYTPHILEHLTRGGILVTAKVGDRVNPITIGWGTIGMQWGKPLFQAYIRECRHTKAMLDEAREFTVNIPLERTERVKGRGRGGPGSRRKRRGEGVAMAPPQQARVLRCCCCSLFQAHQVGPPLPRARGWRAGRGGALRG